VTYLQTAADVLAKCSANDPWFPKPSQAMAMAWAEHFEFHQLSRADLLDAVRAFYDETESAVKISPAAIVKRARVIRRDRMGRQVVLELQDASKIPMPDEIREQIRAIAASTEIPR